MKFSLALTFGWSSTETVGRYLSGDDGHRNNNSSSSCLDSLSIQFLHFITSISLRLPICCKVRNNSIWSSSKWCIAIFTPRTEQLHQHQATFASLCPSTAPFPQFYCVSLLQAFHHIQSPNPRSFTIFLHPHSVPYFSAGVNDILMRLQQPLRVKYSCEISLGHENPQSLLLATRRLKQT